MNIGVSTSCFYPLCTELSLCEVGKGGADLTEVFFNARCESTKEFIASLTEIKNRYNLNIKSVHPTDSLAESFNLFSGYDRRFNENIVRYQRYAEIVNEWGGEYIILHGGKPNQVMDDYGYFEKFAEIGEILKREGATLLQENVFKFRAGNIDFLKKMADYLGDSANFCLDVKQCLRGGYSPFDVLDLLKDKVKHIHISDSNSKKDCLLPFDGNFDFASFFKKAKSVGYKGDAIIEVYSYAYKEYSEIFTSYNKLKRCLEGI